MKLIRNAFALGFAVTAVTMVACSSQHGSTVGEPGSAGGQVGINSEGHGDVGSVGMHLTIGNGVHVNKLNWTISNGTNTYSNTVNITDDAGNEAQSIEFVAGGIQAGGGYTVTLSGFDSKWRPVHGHLGGGHRHAGCHQRRGRHRHLHRCDRRIAADDHRQRQHRR